MNFTEIPELRKGQIIFNFLCWLKAKKGYHSYTPFETDRMADPFHIRDEDFDALYDEYLNHMGVICH